MDLGSETVKPQNAVPLKLVEVESCTKNSTESVCENEANAHLLNIETDLLTSI